ncbi:hypothetical protein CC79DRAFT_1336206 [Sarocladium strictum]
MAISLGSGSSRPCLIALATRPYTSPSMTRWRQAAGFPLGGSQSHSLQPCPASEQPSGPGTHVPASPSSTPAMKAANLHTVLPASTFPCGGVGDLVVDSRLR